MVGLSVLQRALMAVARRAYRLAPLPESARLRVRFFLKTRLGVLFGRRRAWSYERWINTYDIITAQDARAIAEYVEAHPALPRFTVIVPVPHGETHARRHATACLKSVRTQLYERFDTIACGPGASASLVEAAGFASGMVVLAPTPISDPATWLRAGLAQASTPWIVFLRHDALLGQDALALLAAAIQEHPAVQALYGDEDDLSVHGERSDPTFKPELNLELLLSQDYMGPMFAVHRDALERAGGVRDGFGEAVVYDLMVRLATTQVPEIRRVPFILTHRETGSAEGRLGEEQRRVVMNYFARQKIAVDEVEVMHTGDLHICYSLGPRPPLITVIVPTRDRVDLLRTCLNGVLLQTDYPAVEIIVVDNQSREPATHAYFRELSADSRVRILPFDAPYNFSAINNAAAKLAKGDLICLLNNDIAIIEPGWLKEMAGHALHPDVGAVGCKLLYENGTIQHAGMVMGLVGLTGHLYRHLPRDSAGHGRRLMVAQELSGVTAACLLVRRKVYEEVGGLDETLPFSCNDVDFCLRIGAKGYRNIFTPHAVLFHLESITRGHEPAPSVLAQIRKEEATIRTRWATILMDDPCYSPNLALESESPMLAVPPRVRRPWRSAASR